MAVTWTRKNTILSQPRMKSFAEVPRHRSVATSPNSQNRPSRKSTQTRKPVEAVGLPDQRHQQHETHRVLTEHCPADVNIYQPGQRPDEGDSDPRIEGDTRKELQAFSRLPGWLRPLLVTRLRLFASTGASTAWPGAKGKRDAGTRFIADRSASNPARIASRDQRSTRATLAAAPSRGAPPDRQAG